MTIAWRRGPAPLWSGGLGWGPRPSLLIGSLALLLCFPAPGPGQQADRQELDATVAEISRAWERGDMGTVADRMTDGGVLLHLPEAVHPGLSIRMARAALEELHARTGSGDAEVDRVRALGGAPARASVELLWSPVPPGMTRAMSYTVFMGLERGPEGWQIAEVRILGGKAPSSSTKRPSP